MIIELTTTWGAKMEPMLQTSARRRNVPTVNTMLLHGNDNEMIQDNTPKSSWLVVKSCSKSINCSKVAVTKEAPQQQKHWNRGPISTFADNSLKAAHESNTNVAQ